MFPPDYDPQCFEASSFWGAMVEPIKLDYEPDDTLSWAVVDYLKASDAILDELASADADPLVSHTMASMLLTEWHERFASLVVA
jgi:hypothetical protein